MKESDDLFQLIRSLTKNEKGYFKKYSSMHTIGKQNKYLQLFDAIDRQKKYDEALLKKKFSKERFVKQFHVAKNYLYNQILLSTEEYQVSVDAQLRSLLNQGEFLLDKLLYKQCQKILNKAKSLAKRNEKFPLLMDISLIENRLIRRQHYALHSKEEIESLFEEEFDHVKKYNNLIEYRYLMYKMFIRIYKDGRIDEQRQDAMLLKTLVNEPLFKDPKKALSYRAKIFYYTGLATYYHIKEDHKRAYEGGKELIQLYESQPQYIQNNPAEYHNALKNIIASGVNLGKHDSIYRDIEKLRSVEQRSRHLQYENFSFAYNVLLTIKINTGEFKLGEELIKKMQEEIAEQKLEPFFKKGEIVFDYCFAYIYFGMCDFKKAKYYLNKILNSRVDLRSDIYGHAKILSIIIHFEMEDQDLIESSVRSAYRYLYKRNRLFKFETLLLNFIRKKLPKIDTEKELISAFRSLKNEIQLITKDPIQNRSIDYFDFISWLDSKIEGRAFAEVVKEKARKGSLSPQ